jgi:hypothetical protein
VFSGNPSIRKIAMAQAELNDGQVLYGMNDLFIGPKCIPQPAIAPDWRAFRKPFFKGHHYLDRSGFNRQCMA